MKQCSQCGMKFSEEFQFCPKCGTPVKPETPADKAGDPAYLDKTIHRATPGYGALFLDNLPQGYVIEERYEIKAKIGQGGFGAVYLAYDRKMEIEKALKVIPEAIVHDVEAMESLRREARTMIRLNHPHIVRVYDFHDSGAIKFIDMEYVSGESLSALKVKQPDKRFSEAQVEAYAIQIAEALAYAHGQGVIHRDIKPQNIMLNKAGQVKIMDFGIAETVRTSMSRIANVSTSGTLLYMSPEQVRGREIGRESDIYSFGATLYELLCGHPPFYRGDITYQILHEQPAPIADISEEMNAFLLKCLAKESGDRFGNFEEVLEVLRGEKQVLFTEAGADLKAEAESVEAEESVARSPEGERRKPPPVRAGHWWYWVAGIGAILVLFIIMHLRNVGEENRRKVERQKWLNMIDWVWVPGGSFEMGSNNGDSDERPVHEVYVDGFYISKYKITFDQYDRFCEATGRSKPDDEGWGRGNRPVINVSWEDAVAFCEWLSDKTGETIRLPTEAEWEYAARGGNRSRGYKYAGSNDVDAVAWYDGNSGDRTHPVGQKQPNELGLYDMSGNVWEWCLDWYDSDYYSNSPRNNPRGPSSGASRVVRGGSWFSTAGVVRVAFRGRNDPGLRYFNLGFRPCREKKLVTNNE